MSNHAAPSEPGANYVARLATIDPDMPDYLFLVASNLAPAIIPKSCDGFRPEVRSAGYLDLLPRWAVASLMAIGLPSAAVASMLVRIAQTVQAMNYDTSRMEARKKDRLDDSIDQLVLANHAMFTFMNEAWGITEAEVATRMQEILRAEFEAFARSIAADLEKQATSSGAPENAAENAA